MSQNWSFKNVFLERTIEIYCLVIYIYHFWHKSKYILHHLFITFWVFWNLLMETHNYSAQMEWFYKNPWLFSFLGTFVGGWKDDTSSFASKSNLHVCITIWDSSFSFAMFTQTNITHHFLAWMHGFSLVTYKFNHPLKYVTNITNHYIATREKLSFAKRVQFIFNILTNTHKDRFWWKSAQKGIIRSISFLT